MFQGFREPDLTIYFMSSHVEQFDCSILEPDLVQNPELPTDFIRLNALPLSYLSQTKSRRILSVQKL